MLTLLDIMTFFLLTSSANDLIAIATCCLVVSTCKHKLRRYIDHTHIANKLTQII